MIQSIGVSGPWGTLLREITGQVVGTGLEIVRGQNADDINAAPPQIIVQQSPMVIPWVPIALGVGAIAALWLLFGRKGRR